MYMYFGLSSICCYTVYPPFSLPLTFLPFVPFSLYHLSPPPLPPSPLRSSSGGAIFSIAGITTVDTIVMIFAVFSMIQCIRSLVKSLHFAKIVKTFFIKKYNYKLKFHQVLPLFNLWFLMVVISNLLVLVGSLIKILLNLNVRCCTIPVWQSRVEIKHCSIAYFDRITSSKAL